MAVAIASTNPFASLLNRRGVSVLSDNPAPHEAVTAIVMGKTLYCEIRSAPAGHTAMFHFRDGEWWPLGIPTTLDRAVAAIVAFFDRVWGLPPGWSFENDVAMRDAALGVFAGPAADDWPLAA